MNNDRNLMQQALDALLTCTWSKETDDAIAALRGRLACEDVLDRMKANARELGLDYEPMQPCAGRNCGSTNPNLHSAEWLEEQSEKRQYDADHVVLENGTNDCVCTHCGQRYHIHMPVPIGIMTAIVDAFLETHHQCEKPGAA